VTGVEGIKYCFFVLGTYESFCVDSQKKGGASPQKISLPPPLQKTHPFKKYLGISELLFFCGRSLLITPYIR